MRFLVARDGQSTAVYLVDGDAAFSLDPGRAGLRVRTSWRSSNLIRQPGKNWPMPLVPSPRWRCQA